MTLTEKELLTRFLQQLASANAGAKDAEAEALIRETVARQPDAAYLLTQRALQLEQLLQASREQVETLRSERGPRDAASGGRFLADPNAWGSRTSASAAQPPGQRGFGASAMTPAHGRGSWTSGLFGNIAATAAGVVAGSFLFQGIQGMMDRSDGGEPATGTAELDAASTHQAASEPELLNSFDTDSQSDMFADLDDTGDFV